MNVVLRCHGYIPATLRARGSILSVLAMVCLAGFPATLTAQITGDRELLRLVAVQNRANRDAIITWSGSLQESQHLVGRFGTDDVDLVREWQVDYSFDRVRRLYAVRYRQLRESGKKNGQPFTDDTLVTWGAIRLPDVFLRVPHWREPVAPDDRPMRPDLVLCNLADERKNIMSPDFDPFHFFMIISSDTHDRLMAFYKASLDPARQPIPTLVERKGNLVSVRIGIEPVTELSVFDLDQGANPVEIDGKGSNHRNVIKTSFVQVSGVWVPATASIVSRHNSGPQSDRTLTWTSNNINKDLDEHAFSPTWLGIRKGDKVRDKRTGAEYLYDEETDPLTPPRRSRTWVYAVVGGAGLLTLLLMLAGWRWRRRTAQEAAHVA